MKSSLLKLCVSRLHAGEPGVVGSCLPAEAGRVSGSGPDRLHHLRGLPGLCCGGTPHRRIRRFLEERFPVRKNTRSWGRIHTTLLFFFSFFLNSETSFQFLIGWGIMVKKNNVRMNGLVVDHSVEYFYKNKKRNGVNAPLCCMVNALRLPAVFYRETKVSCTFISSRTDSENRCWKSFRIHQSPWNKFLTCRIFFCPHIIRSGSALLPLFELYIRTSVIILWLSS